jgi:protein-tyrosine-phosphatase
MDRTGKAEPAPGSNFRGILFLCVANSARSQMAEGIARSLAPSGVRVFSAGSVPRAVNPLAVRVLAEIGIDISGAQSKPISQIPHDAIDLVITLCSEEVCPVFVGEVRRLDWGFPDPAAVEGPEAVRLEVFRSLRDQLVAKIGKLLRE